MLTYSQSTGILTDSNGLQLAHGWAGHSDGKNNPDAQTMRGVGPLPRGTYSIAPWEAMHGHLGPMVAKLIPDSTNNMRASDGGDRDSFYIHGPSTGSNYGQESNGCIVLLRADRVTLKNCGDNRLEVVR